MNTPATPTRLSELDALRCIAFTLLILYHVGMFYVSWDWHVKSADPVTALEPLMRLSSPWRLALLFVIAGAALRLWLDGRAERSAALIGARSRRLLPPLLFGMLVIVPPQAYLEVVQKLDYASSYLDFMARYLRADGSFCRGGDCLILPTWNHLWFVAYLWLYTVLALLLRARSAAPVRAGAGTADRTAAWLAHGARLLWVPWLLFALLRQQLAPHFPTTHNLVWDWYSHALFGSMFALGWWLFGRRHDEAGLWAAAERLRWLALGTALAAWVALLAYDRLLQSGPQPADPPEAWRMLMRCVTALMQWLPVLAALGFARRHFAGRDGPRLRTFTEAVFPCYILHQTLTVVAAHHLARLRWPQPLEAAVLVAVTVGGSWAGYLLVRRVRWLRPLFGLAPRPALSAMRRAGAPNPAAPTRPPAACGG